MGDNTEKLQSLIADELEAVSLAGGTLDEQFAELSTRLRRLNTQSLRGYIRHFGTTYKGEYQVQFATNNVPNPESWSSRWPEWAAKSARDALLHNREVWVIYDTVPYGPNLLLVLVTNLTA